MNKIIGLSSITLLSLVLMGCGDSNTEKFEDFAKDAVKDKKQLVVFYDIKNNKNYNYSYYQFIGESTSSKIDQFLSSPMIKDCSISKEKMNEVALSNDSITFTCAYSYKDVLTNMDTPPDKKVKIKIVGEKSSDNQSILDMNDINFLLNFKDNTVYNKSVDEITGNVKSTLIEGLKQTCKISDDKQVYDDCLSPHSRLKITGL
ncbi:hypothetical protein GA0061081_10242 [Gilliamella bombicola]|uniref:Lipoprotein n=1 Tax=Gilliamella bombicola TaxID=1798182 RepID=A0A1C3ZPQ9_9GAMM|nr:MULTISPECIES: hypothetical protein [Gilliamella]NUF26949.1 hypothetical protein [Gilliamella sp. ESL0254]SCB84358.1 hypothetical protein GA0061081_10242 [Gilliamella bombicola]